ncbi:MAG: HEPN domain-containing protein [Candidatus Aminicenantales bacterium]
MASEDLTEGYDRFKHGRYKYATINSYYAVFHAARALVYSKGYRERSHYCLGVALESMFADRGLLGRRYVKIFRDTMALREDADYGGAYSKEGACTASTNAEEFIGAAGKLI